MLTELVQKAWPSVDQFLVNFVFVKYKVPAKRSQHANATYCIIVETNMLRAFRLRVAMCCDILDAVDSNLTHFQT